MISKFVKVKDGSEIEVVASKASPAIMEMAKSLIISISQGQVRQGSRVKVLQRKKKWLSYRINRRYRLLVKRQCLMIGPYYCMSHNKFDKWVNKH